ncbi:MAG TPA: YhjD/YihY/BrkB family envelope integrity protein [Lapillicoccus sp.]|nr:YhjD/YihY/BrkB family envelope integrity protein [Lapillicoccus sp.]
MSASGSENGADGADETPSPARHPSRLGEARERIYATRDRVISSRGRYHQIDMALRTWERDVEAGGSLMAAALAFRLFLWTLPATVFLVGLLGFTVDDTQVETVGLRGYALATVEQAATQAHHSRWLLVILGGVLLLGVSYTLTKTVVVATALIWGQPLRSVHRPVRAIGIMLVAMSVAVGLAALGSWLRSSSPGIGLVATIAVAGLWALLWWLVSYLLPHADGLPWWGLLPGAVFIGIGTLVLHLATVYYFGVRLSSASELYGSLGTAATMLLWAYVVSRLVLASASINVAAVRTYGPAG